MILVAIGLVLIVVLWAAFIRPVATLEGIGMITGKTLQTARDVTNTTTNEGRTEYHSSSVRVPQGYAFTVELPEGKGTGVFYLEEKFGEPFQIGQKVKISYQVRGLPPLWKRTFVLQMDPSEP